MADAKRFEFRIDPPPDPTRAERGRVLFAGPIDFVIGAARLDQLPEGDRMEICFAGRSNVGKSTLINRLSNRKALARASNTPGRTQQLNYFDVGGRLYMVDLPGYGYAQAPKSVVDAWQDLLRSYLRGRASLRRVFLLIDGRHGPKSADEDIMKLLDSAAVAFQTVVTKADKPKSAELAAAIDKTADALQAHPTAHPDILVTSSESGRGVDSLRDSIMGLLEEN